MSCIIKFDLLDKVKDANSIMNIAKTKSTYINDVDFKDKEQVARVSAFELRELLSVLKDKLNIHTSLELLRLARLSKVEIVFVNEGIPLLKQNKYILVPSYYSLENTNIPISSKSGRKIRDISILQEHLFSTDEYLLTLGEPKRKRKR